MPTTSKMEIFPALVHGQNPKSGSISKNVALCGFKIGITELR